LAFRWKFGAERCAKRVFFGFGPPGSPVLDADAWYCTSSKRAAGSSGHQHEGDRLWTARYRPSGGFGDALL